MTDRVTINVSNGIADVRFNRADKRNALDGDQFVAIAEAGEQLKSTEGLRAVVLSGEGESFCAGLDFAMFGQMAGDGEFDASSQSNPARIMPSGITQLAQQVCWVWQELPVPVIAAVQGHALGGGFQIAMGADIRISHPDAKWSVRELHWGIIPDMTGTFMLSRLVRNDIARELTYTARVFGGVEAHEIGVATRLSDTPFEAAMEMATDIASRNPHGVRGAKQLFNTMFTDGAAEQFDAERQVIKTLIGSPNQVEAIMANLEGRPPTFTD